MSPPGVKAMHSYASVGWGGHAEYGYPCLIWTLNAISCGGHFHINDSYSHCVCWWTHPGWGLLIAEVIIAAKGSLCHAEWAVNVTCTFLLIWAQTCWEISATIDSVSGSSHCFLWCQPTANCSENQAIHWFQIKFWLALCIVNLRMFFTGRSPNSSFLLFAAMHLFYGVSLPLPSKTCKMSVFS